MWIDTHCHLDAPELWRGPSRVFAAASSAAMHTQAAYAQARGAWRANPRIALCMLPAVEVANFDAVRSLAHAGGDAYALGIHPVCVPQAQEADLHTLDAALTAHASDPHLVAVGEIGLDFFVPALCTPALRERQQFFYRAQLKLAKKHGLPVVLHVRRSADVLLKHLREVFAAGGAGGIAHAFNGSAQQAQAFVGLGFKLGFGGAVTFEAALQLRRLAAHLPLHALVLETDSPDIPPQWLYKTAQQRAAGEPQGINTPAQLPRIGALVAGLRGISAESLAAATCANALQALPRLRTLLHQQATQSITLPATLSTAP
ncbi:MAG: TatD family hydrolase [Burkholderiales bacterium]